MPRIPEISAALPIVVAECGDVGEVCREGMDTRTTACFRKPLERATAAQLLDHEALGVERRRARLQGQRRQPPVHGDRRGPGRRRRSTRGTRSPPRSGESARTPPRAAGAARGRVARGACSACGPRSPDSRCAPGRRGGGGRSGGGGPVGPRPPGSGCWPGRRPPPERYRSHRSWLPSRHLQSRSGWRSCCTGLPAAGRSRPRLPTGRLR